MLKNMKLSTSITITIPLFYTVSQFYLVRQMDTCKAMRTTAIDK
jgi:hypothetical protein